MFNLTTSTSTQKVLLLLFILTPSFANHHHLRHFYSQDVISLEHDNSGIIPIRRENVTMYHVLPSYFVPSNIGNMNLADLRGDLFYDLLQRFSVFACSDNDGSSVPIGVKCKNERKDDDDNNGESDDHSDNEDVVIAKLVVEVSSGTTTSGDNDDDDDLYGPYATCNACDGGHDPIKPDRVCGDNTDDNEKRYICDCYEDSSSFPPRPAECGLDRRVGREEISVTFGNKGIGRFCAMGGWDTGVGESSCAMSNAADLIKGYWYSTLSFDDDDGSSNGWKTVQVVKRIGKRCHSETFLDKIESLAREQPSNNNCFESCLASGSLTRDTSSPCWVRCFAEAALGPGSTRSIIVPSPDINRMTADELMGAWEYPFNDVSDGGCPEISYDDTIDNNKDNENTRGDSETRKWAISTPYKYTLTE